MTFLWPIFLILLFLTGLAGAGYSGDVRGIALCVFPGWVFSKWMRVR